MAAVSPDEFRRLLSKLDGDEFVSFVADLWERRGYETAGSGSAFEALNRTTGERERVVVARRSRLRWRLPDGAADVVVAPRSTAATRRLARARSATFVGPATLRRMTRYAVGSEDRRRLFELHFGRSLDESSSHAWRDRIDPASGRELIVTLAVLAAVVLAVAVPQYTGERGPSGPEPGTTVGAAATGTTTATPDTARRGSTSFPPGVDDGGVVDANRLGAAHAEALGGTSYRLSILRRISVADGNGTQTMEGYREMSVNGTDQFRTVSGGNLPVSEGGFGSMPVEVYADGTDVYRRVGEGNDSVFVTGPSMRADRFRNRAQWFVSVYLATDDGDVSRVMRTGKALYTVAATGTPPSRLGDGITNYTAVAVVESDGFVRSLTVSYDRTDDGMRKRIEFEFVYRDRGDVDVAEPAWYPDARNATV